MELSAKNARELWKALMANAALLWCATRTLTAFRRVFGRAWSLTVLAQEELGKALWIYDAFQDSWSAGKDDIQVVKVIKEHGRNHARKYMEAIVFGRELASFWGDYGQDDDYGDDQESWERIWQERRQKAEVAAKEANLLKQRGFYVDQEAGGSIQSPAGIEQGELVQDLQTAAQVIEMLLISQFPRHGLPRPSLDSRERSVR